MPYVDFEDLPRRTVANKVLCDKAFNITKNPKCDGYQHGLPWVIYKFLDKKISGGAVKSKIMSNQQSAEELHKPVISTFEKMNISLIVYKQYLRCWSSRYAIDK